MSQLAQRREVTMNAAGVSMARRVAALMATVLVALGSGVGAMAGEPVSFVEQVQPLLVSQCVSCHGPEKQEGGLRLDSLAAAMAGGDQGPAIVPGNLDESLLVKAITFLDADLQMPPRKKLSDREIATLTEWVKSGAAWPEPVAVLFEDDPRFLAALTSGNGRGRLVAEGAFRGAASLGITPLQRDAVKIPEWNFAIREVPAPGEYRFLRIAWKKRGKGSVMVELAADGKWPDAKEAKGRYVAGPNGTGWAAISVGDAAPTEWKVETLDLWKDIGAFTLTGIAPTCDGGDEAYFDSILLGPTRASLDGYRPGSSGTGDLGRATAKPIGDAFTDKQNPIYKLWGGERLDLWSLKPPRAEAGQTVDSLVQKRLEAAKQTLAPEADRRTLLRRLTFDLTGLPPTPDEVDAFLADRSADAYHKVVDRLLASPRFGERQARLWLDVVRYADTNGYERDEFRPLIWRYRDYVVRSFNADKPFDQFIREQLAGDELLDGPPTTSAEADRLIATGFLRLGQWDSTAPIFQEEARLRAEMMADLTNTTASAFLGMTFSCCQCHDHKYDPLSQADHFRLRAFFAGVTPHDAEVIDTVVERAAMAAHNAAIDEQLAVPRERRGKLLDDARARVVAERKATFPPEIRELLEKDPATRDGEAEKQLKPYLEKLNVNDADAKAACDETGRAELERLEKTIGEGESRKQESRTAMAAADSGEIVPATHILYQGDHASPRGEVEPGFASFLDPQSAVITRPRPGTTGRRLALANWIASPDNPWTARVFVNRVWQQHFGTGLVATPNDFGYSGARPVHPELLDWLAVEFIRGGWSVKELHRLIVCSATYKQAAVNREPAVSGSQSENSVEEGLAALRPQVRRLDAETLRDALLSVSGLMKPFDSGKPLWPPVPEDLLHAQPAILEAKKGGDGGRMQGWYESPLEETDVRSLFLVRKRCLPIPFLQAFDLPDTTVSCARRDTTVVAPQALMLLNSPDGIRYATAFAEQLAASRSLDFDNTGETEALIDSLFRQALVRATTADERALALEFLRRHRDGHAKSAAAPEATRLALTDLCRAVLNLNEFAYID